MTQREIENDMKKSVGGASFITPGELARYLGEKNTSRVREKYMSDAFRIEGTKVLHPGSSQERIVRR